MPDSETLKKINRARKLLKDALILLEDLDLEKPDGNPGKEIDSSSPVPKTEVTPSRRRRDHL